MNYQENKGNLLYMSIAYSEKSFHTYKYTANKNYK